MLQYAIRLQCLVLQDGLPLRGYKKLECAHACRCVEGHESGCMAIVHGVLHARPHKLKQM